jgi:hypothetical protein
MFQNLDISVLYVCQVVINIRKRKSATYPIFVWLLIVLLQGSENKF